MKYVKYTLLCFTLICGSEALKAQQSETISDVIAGFNSGYSDAIGSHLNDNVELVMKSVDNVFTKQQTKTILADFFKKNPPLKFKLMHKGEKENAQYVIGNLETTTGSYRVYFLIKNNLIQQLRIESSND